MITADRNYRDILRDQLNVRIKANPRYSLRAFARDLNVAPSRLSEILNGKQGLSKESALKLAKKLGFTKEEIAIFCDLVESIHARSRLSQDVAKVRLQKHLIDQSYKSLQVDAFTAVSDWYHFAIIQLMKLDGFQSDPDWIAQKLEINRSEVIAALERLARLELIEIHGKQYRTNQDYVSSPDGVPADAIKKFHKQILEKATASMFMQSVDERDFSAIIMPVDSSQIGGVKKSIKTFRRKLCRSASSAKKLDQLYCLSIQFFRITQKGSLDES
jgi:uncharacterized protein (TIGR02147 family)